MGYWEDEVVGLCMTVCKSFGPKEIITSWLTIMKLFTMLSSKGTQ